MLRRQINFLFSQQLEGRWLASFYFPSFCSLVRPPALTMKTWRIVQVASPRTGKTKVEIFQSSRLEVRFSTPLISGQPCVFPFTDQSGSLHYTCTANDDPYGEVWCATQTDQDNSVIEWGHCSPGCQDNAKGQIIININKLKFISWLILFRSIHDGGGTNWSG